MARTITATEAAEALGLTSRTVRNRAQDLGVGRQVHPTGAPKPVWLFSPADLEKIRLFPRQRKKRGTGRSRAST